MEIDLIKESIKNHAKHPKYDGDFSLLAVINSNLHIVGGYGHNEHLLWRRKTRQFDENSLATIHAEVDNIFIQLTYKFIHISNNDKKIMLRRSRDGDYSYCEYSLDNVNREWTIKKEAETLSGVTVHQLRYIESTIYILILAADSTIYIVDVNTWNVYKSKVSNPGVDIKCQIIGMDATQRNKQLIVQGFVRKNGTEFPMDLLGLIAVYYNNVNVHLLANYGEVHCKISMDVLMEDITIFETIESKKSVNSVNSLKPLKLSGTLYGKINKFYGI